jgi:hypothetical protein
MKKIWIFFSIFYSTCFGSGYDLYINPPSNVLYRSFTPTSDGGFILCGDIKTALTNESTSFYFERYDSTGNILWTKQYYDTSYFNSSGFDKNQAKEIVTDNNGGFIFVGSVFSDYYERVYYVGKIDANGNFINSITYWGEVYASGDQIKKSYDSTYVFTFHEYEGAGHGYEGFVKIDENLNTVWQYKFGYGLWISHALSINPDNSIYSTLDGSTFGSESIYEYSPSCYSINHDGTLSYKFTFGYDSLSNGGQNLFDYNLIHAISGTPNHSLLVAGVKNNVGNQEISLMYIDSTGDSLWTKYFGGPGKDNAFDIILCSDSGYALTGYTSDSCVSTFTDIFLMKLDKNTDSVWTKIYRGTFHNAGTAVQHTSDGGFMIFGYSDSLARIIKTDANGNIVAPFALTTNQNCNLYCNGDTAKLYVNPSGASYLWSSGQTTRNISVTAPGLYSVNVTDVNGINYPLYSSFISFTPAPSTSFVSDTIHFCDTLKASTNSSLIPGYNFQWYHNDTLIPFATNETYLINASGNYGVIVSGICGIDTAEFYAMIHQRPSKPDIHPNTSLMYACQGDTVRLYTSSNSPTYQWFTNYFRDTISGATNNEYYMVADNTFHTYRVVTFNQYGCYNYSDETTIFSLVGPHNTSLYQTPNYRPCPGDTVNLETFPYYNTYLWNTGDTTQSIKVNQPGIYYNILLQGTACESTSDTINVNYFPLPPISLVSDTTVCKGSTLYLVAGHDSIQYKYLWQDLSQAYFYPVNTSLADTFQFFIQMTDTITSCSTTDSGNVIIDNCLEVELVNSEKINIYPNPIHNYMVIDAEIEGEMELIIFAIDGKKILQQKISANNRIVNMSGLTDGFYFVRIGDRGVWKLVKE